MQRRVICLKKSKKLQQYKVIYDLVSLQLDWHSLKTLASLLCVTGFRRFC